MDKLLPCPFCGCEPKIFKDPYGFMAIHCFGCGAHMIAETKKESNAKWNHRAPIEPRKDDANG